MIASLMCQYEESKRHESENIVLLDELKWLKMDYNMPANAVVKFKFRNSFI